MSSLYYDRKGRPMTREQFALAFELERERHVAMTELPNGKWVSTVWLGIDHGWGDTPPLIFESMVFESVALGESLDCERYSTEREALAGHARLVRKWANAGRRLKKRVRAKKIARVREERKKSRRLLRDLPFYRSTRRRARPTRKRLRARVVPLH